MNKIRKTIDLVGLVFAACLFIWSVTAFQYTSFKHQQINKELNFFEMSIEELMDIEVASAPLEIEIIPKTSWVYYVLRNSV
ncbi:MAG: hypothetical protein ACYSSP_00330 [Planctomycetota bacterium]|jgi:hypothetical protein